MAYCGGGAGGILTGGGKPSIGVAPYTRALMVSALTVRAPSGQQQHPESASEKRAMMK
jgi:hypothetical protein